ncbi:MAG: insulinase family protein [Bryobacterales bacterium]|nr:insulinase family protein [Bryobacterales bacterium]
MRSALILALALAVSAPLAPAQRKSAPAAAARSYKDLKFKSLRELRLPEISNFTMANGMKVYLLENHELPLVRGSLRLHAGNVNDPSDKVGLSDVFGEVMRTGGAKDKTGDQLNELLEGMAASVETDIGETAGTVSFNTLTENTGTVLAIFKDILTQPEFRQEKLDIAKNQYRGVIARRNDNAGGIASREFERLIYGRNTPWGRQMEYATLDSITRQDLISFHHRYFFPANMVLAIQGDFVSSTMREKLEKLFAEWNPREPPVPPVPPVTNKAVPGVYFAEKKDVNQTSFRLGHLGGRFSDKDYPALDVMNDILGGGQFSSRLVQKVRSDLGLAYNVGSAWHAAYDHPGMFLISGGTKSQSTVEALKAIRVQVDRIRDAEVTDEELRIAKESTLNSFVFAFDSPGKVLSRLMTYEYYGYPNDFIFQYQKAVAAVTKADVLRVAKEYLKPEDFVIVAVGKSEDFGTPLSALGLPIHNIDLTIPEPKHEAVKADPASLAKGRQLLEGLQTAVGGADKLAAVKDYTHTAQVTLTGAQAGLKVTQITKVIYPRIRFEQQLPFGKIIIYYDGKGGGFMVGPQGSSPLPPQAAKQAKEELFRYHPILWLSDRDPERTVNATGDHTVEISDKENNWIRLTLDPSTGLIAKVTYRGVGMTGPTEVEAVYEDWKSVDGVKLPYHIKISQGGKPAAEVSVTEYKLNSGLKPEDLARKP